MTTDYVFINNMELGCHIGTTEDERAFPQILWISIRIYLSLHRAAETSDLHHTIDYAAVIQHIREHTRPRKYVLVETLANDIATICLESALANSVDIEIKKKVFEGVEAVGASLHREKKSA